MWHRRASCGAQWDRGGGIVAAVVLVSVHCRYNRNVTGKGQCVAMAKQGWGLFGQVGISKHLTARPGETCCQLLWLVCISKRVSPNPYNQEAGLNWGT